ncbi:hypothetical protein ACIGMX_12650 [Streptomyces aquilus]|uniref:hypothetical protein n=1 Tax=Streptomyces aquilus TaxID=2548456 RepID=UPI0037D30947
MTRADRLTLVRQLREEGLSQRATAKRLKISKDTVRRDWELLDAEAAPDDAPPGAPDDADAPQASEGAAEQRAPVDAPPGEPVAQEADDRAPQDAPLPPRVAQPEVIHLDAAMRRDLAVLAPTGHLPQDLVRTALAVLAAGYRDGVRAGVIAPGPFTVLGVHVGPPLPEHFGPRRPAGLPPVEGA